jgi:hypothetical protein
MYDVAFQDYQLQNPQSLEPWIDYPGDGDPPPDPPLDPPPSPPPPAGEPDFGPLLPWEAVLDDLAAFFDDMGSAVHAPTGTDQNSYYDRAEDSSPLNTAFIGMFGWMAGVVDIPGHNYYDYLTQGADPELFSLVAYDAANFFANFSHGTVAAQTMSNGLVAMTLNGITVYGEWHQGNSSPTGPDDIVVNGGHWHFIYTGWDPSHYEGQPPPPIPATEPVIANPENAEVLAELERQSLSTRLHQYLDEHGGHATVTFHGPNGDETFQLEDLVNIIDHYRIVGTNGDYLAESGGGGRVRLLPDGTYVSEVNTSLLAAYETMHGGLDFFILHEAGHMLQIAQTYTHNNFEAWIAGGGTAASYVGTTGYNGSPALYRSESYSNNIAAAVERLIHIEPLARPPAGYGYTGIYWGS